MGGFILHRDRDRDRQAEIKIVRFIIRMLEAQLRAAKRRLEELLS